MPEPGGTTARAREGLPLLRSEEEAVVVAVADEDLLELGSEVVDGALQLLAHLSALTQT